MSEVPRYYVQSEHVRGERRAWLVMDRGEPRYTSRSYDPIVYESFDRRRAEKLCEKLNAATAK